MKRLIGSYLFLILISLPLLAIGQEKGSERPEPAHASGSYKVDVLLSENEGGKRINTRAYTFVVESGRTIRLRQGLRVPVVTGTGGNSSQYQYLDVGLGIDCEVAEVENGVRVNVSVDESSLATEPPGGGGHPGPVIRQFKDGGMAVIPLGKQTLLSSAEELDSKKRLDIEATVNKLR